MDISLEQGKRLTMSRPLGIDLFAGAGGLSLGFEQAGFDVVAAVEIDPIHAAVHEFNFPHCAVIPQSVEHLTGSQIRSAAGIGKRKIDVVFGGAPCQGFSLIGQRALDDPRNALVRHFVRLVRELDAETFVFENVKGITVGKHAQFLQELIDEFSSIGYEIRLPWRILNAAHFGAPQHRERLILMGCKRGRNLPTYPEPMFRPAGSRADLPTLPEGPSCYDALEDIPDAEQFPELNSSDSVRVKWGKASAYARPLRGLIRADWDFSYKRQFNPGLLTSSMRTDHTEISRRRFKATGEGEVEPISRFFKLPSSGVSNTLRAGTDSARGAFTSPRPVHYKYARCVTVREMARLHGFPDWFRLHQTKWHGARQIGNAVPPPLARAVAAQVMTALGVQPVVPDEEMELGNSGLLRMDMGQAANHFGVPVVIGKRDKKGAPKRKQWDERTTVRVPAEQLVLYPFDAGTELV
ncbi:DNA cytosine methyltransferase [Caballeronia sp. LZ062]|uniref:DNA cytosine methyltransferase n=1 Tax=unclassified Caballeronia TaxID=2646786 RepID=UPI00285E8712|nr:MULTISPECIES: DNA cytosine methyltransferase [unclassified Caballeronia]MDR5855859.1 DNA cytosine methyltransferase [Caballeronia sp. LZ050]MDR5872355.1 DNA cytosine methyltransferase [Caballeronia sp. LZ062]